MGKCLTRKIEKLEMLGSIVSRLASPREILGEKKIGVWGWVGGPAMDRQTTGRHCRGTSWVDVKKEYFGMFSNGHSKTPNVRVLPPPPLTEIYGPVLGRERHPFDESWIFTQKKRSFCKTGKQNLFIIEKGEMSFSCKNFNTREDRKW